MVSERTDNLIQVVDDLLFMQDIESGNAYLCLEAVSVPHLVQRVCCRMRSRIQRKAIILQVTIQENEKTPIIQGDPLRLEQAFTHLLDNAIKFSASGSCISVEMGIRGRHLYLSVHNQGPNILPENLAHLDTVDSFYQVTPSSRQQAGDLGMGLLLVKYIAEMHGGDVTITSDPDAGTTVCLTLPLEDKGRLLHQSLALTTDSANKFRMALQSFSAPQPAWQTI
jgi:signal transduction histidine kinase